jgi:beta-lactamase superfamily II metal-dependent hydrolase
MELTRRVEMNKNKLLVRIYDVGFGDCVYVRVPDKDDYYHILIDCGTSGPAKPALNNALNDIRSMLPSDQGAKKRLDLLVATHPHADHIKGFDPKLFKGIRIRNIWLSVFMNKKHPQARQSHALEDLTDSAVSSLVARGLHLAPGLDRFLLNSLCNRSALKALRTTMPKSNKIKPVYVCRDIAKRLTAKKRTKHKLGFKGGTTCLQDFAEASTVLRVLAPEWDIDGYYLGKGKIDYSSAFSLYKHVSGKAVAGGETPKPSNISERDFRQLRERLLYSALAFAQTDDDLKNDTSVVLLLEWRGRRLLFTGDAEWTGRAVKKGRRNSCWDVMLKMDKKGHLSRPLDFLKVGHHGSVNGTPFVDMKGVAQPILDKILPKKGKAKVVVSTTAGKHGKQKEVPYHDLLRELGRRAGNARKYSHDPDIPGVRQPQRTDHEEKAIDVLL